MKVGRFILKLTAIILVVAVCALLINHSFLGTQKYADLYGETEKFKDVPSGITFANFGTSHALAGFIYGEEDKTSFNFALSGESIYNDFLKLKQFTPNLASGCTVVLSVSYFSFCNNVNPKTDKRYYTFLEKKYINGFSWDIWLNARFLPIAGSLEYLFWDKFGQQYFMEFTDTDPTADNVSITAEQKTDITATTVSRFSNTSVQRAESWRSSSFKFGDVNFVGNCKTLIDTINYCRSNGFKPIIAVLPVSGSLNNCFYDGELDKFFFSNLNYCIEKTGVLCFEDSHDADFQNNDDLFSNCDHLNSDGSALFMKKLYAFIDENMK